MTDDLLRTVVLRLGTLAALVGAAGWQARADEPSQAAVASAPAEPTPISTPVATASRTHEWVYLDRGLTFFPEGPGTGKDRWAIGGAMQIIPVFTASYKRGLGDGFAVDAALATIVMFNTLGVGGQWATKVGPFSLGAMAHFNASFGTIGKAFVQTSEFNATGWAFFFNPGLKAGLQVAKNAWVTLQLEGYLSLYQSQTLGTLTLSPNAPAYAGGALTLIVEHAPKREGVIYYGVSLNHTSSNYPIWFNVEATSSSSSVTPSKIWYLGVLAGYEFQ